MNSLELRNLAKQLFLQPKYQDKEGGLDLAFDDAKAFLSHADSVCAEVGHNIHYKHDLATCEGKILTAEWFECQVCHAVLSKDEYDRMLEKEGEK